MLKRTFLNGLLAGTFLTSMALGAMAEGFDGPTTGPKAAEEKIRVHKEFGQ